MDTSDDDSSSPSPMDIFDIIAKQGWLLGALMSLAAAALEGFGMAILKKAQYAAMGEKIRPRDPLPSWRSWIKHPLFWVGLLMVALHSPITMLAIKWAPETTAVPIFGSIVLVNLLVCFGVLAERISWSDVAATLVCVVGLVIMNVAVDWSVPGRLEDFPVSEIVDLSNDMFTNVGFALYMIICSTLLLFCMYVVCFVSLGSGAKPFAWPLLNGILWGFFHMLSKVASTLFVRQGNFSVQQSPLFHRVEVFTILVYIATIVASCEGLRQLSCRFFVPALIVVTQVQTVLQDLLFFREWETMTGPGITLFIIAAVISITSLFFISSKHEVLPHPSHVASGMVRVSSLSSLSKQLLPVGEVLEVYKSITDIMDEYHIRHPSMPNPMPLKIIPLPEVTGTWRLLPITLCVLLLALPFTLWIMSLPFAAFIFLTLFSLVQVWKMGAHIWFFAYVGENKMAYFDKADFSTLYESEIRLQGRNVLNDLKPEWGSIVHFVIVPNYKESYEDLCMTLDSVKSSSIASTQICMVLAMEEREKEAPEKVHSLSKKYRDHFLNIVATYHPQGLKNEVPGKSANTKWAANEVFDKVMPEMGVALENSIVTVADADSEFHREYFAALTYYFISAGGPENETPQRYLTIWQAPIMHMKNYMRQLAFVRMSSFLTSEHELANLSDPNAARVPYSTYSMSASLAKSVGGWDPDWISEDWHMALKCFLCTGGRLKIAPIFLPVLNNTPEGTTWLQTVQARWIQAKRHALGFSELVYLNEHLPYVFKRIDGCWHRAVFVWRAAFLMLKLLMIHLFIALFWVVAPLNGIVVAYFNHHQLTERSDINSWTFLINFVFQAICVLNFFLVFLMSVRLFEALKSRVDGTDQKLSIWWRSPLVHLATLIPQSIAASPVVFASGGFAEWIAALKSAKTHKFQYVTATQGAKEAQRCFPWKRS